MRISHAVSTAHFSPASVPHHHHGMVWRTTASAFFTAALMTEAQADDSIVGRFTSSLTQVYLASQMCEGTLVYSPSNFVSALREYLAQYYPEGAGYWVLPAASMHMGNIDSCMVMLEARLFDYHAASIDFHESYPNEPLPPILRIILEERTISQQRETALSLPVSRTAPGKKIIYNGVAP